MRLSRGCPAGWALSLLILAPQLAPAAWNNAFQVTCNKCRKQRASAYAPVIAYAAPAPPTTCCAPPQVSYVQRSYYQPVTSYQAVTNYEPVTSYRTSYYYEPVTSYHYSSYYDPCSGCCQQVATPTTSYRMRSQCNAVTSYCGRISYRPVTSYRQSCYWEQVQLPSCPTASAAVTVTPPATVAPPVASVPDLNPGGAIVEQQKVTPPPVIDEKITVIPPSQPLRRSTPVPQPPLRAEHVASLSTSPSTLTGQVVLANYSPRSRAKVTFVSASNLEKRQPAIADDDGRFQVNLPAGGWYVYVDNKYHNEMTVRGSEARNVMVLSRK